MTLLFEPLKMRDVSIRNRIGVAPMCQYSAVDGVANEWHLVHLGSRAVGGAGLIIVEATAVEPRGRITPGDLGLWNDGQIEMLSKITAFIHAHGATAAIQIAHAGRKAGTHRPWEGRGAVPADQGGWQVVGPGDVPFDADYGVPHALRTDELPGIVKAFGDAARRALTAGFRVLEIHAAHGYLLHEFLSPLVNHRTDAYGGSLENRARLLLEVTQAVRAVWPENLPLIVRISATDWVEGGWDIEQSIAVARWLKALGVDMIDCSSSGNIATATVPIGPGYQTPFARRIRAEAEIATAAVGLITSPQQAEHILRMGDADMILLAREELRDPYWPLHAADALGYKAMKWPDQYLRART